MRWRNVLQKVCFCWCAMALLTPSFLYVPLFAAGKNSSEIFIVYDTEYQFGMRFPKVEALAEHLGHYGIEPRLLAVGDWQTGDLSRANTVIVVGMQESALPEGLIDEIAKAKKIVWFGKHIEQLAAHLQWSDFYSEGETADWSTVNYRGKTLYEWMRLNLTVPGGGAQVFADAQSFGQSYSLVWRREQVYYSGVFEFSGVFDRLMGYALHDFFPEHSCTVAPRAMLRVEDVSPIVDVKAIREVIRTIESYNIPYAIAVIPVGTYGGGKKIPLHENKELVEVLKAAQANGASIIMHGYTHQNEFSPTTGEGYEFWNARDDKPMENEPTFTSQRLQAGIYELLRCGLIPVAFEAPHYAAGKAAYETMSKYFNLYSGELQISDESAQYTLSLPYISQSPYLNGMLLLPENLGFNDGAETFVEDTLGKAEELRDMPGAFACFFYHGYLPPDRLGPVIQGIQKQGYTFFDLRSLPIQVWAPGVSIFSENGEVSVRIDPELQEAWREKPTDIFSVGKLISTQAGILIVILAALLGIVMKLQRSSKRHYEE